MMTRMSLTLVSADGWHLCGLKRADMRTEVGQVDLGRHDSSNGDSIQPSVRVDGDKQGICARQRPPYHLVTQNLGSV